MRRVEATSFLKAGWLDTPSRNGFLQLRLGTVNANHRFSSTRAQWRGIAVLVRAILFPSYSSSMRGPVARLGRIAGGAIALAVAYALAAPAVLAADQYAKTELGDLISGAPELVVAGERLNLELLRRFYARHGFAPVWPTRQSQANSLTNAVLRAGEHGLAPERFHANLLRSPATLPPMQRETAAVGCLPIVCRHAGEGGNADRAPKR